MKSECQPSVLYSVAVRMSFCFLPFMDIISSYIQYQTIWNSRIAGRNTSVLAQIGFMHIAGPSYIGLLLGALIMEAIMLQCKNRQLRQSTDLVLGEVWNINAS